MEAGRVLRALDSIPPGSLVPVDWIRELLEGAEEGVDATVEDLGRILDRAPSTIRGWCRDGRVPGAYRMNGREWRIPRESLRALRGGDRGQPERRGGKRRGMDRWRGMVK